MDSSAMRAQTTNRFRGGATAAFSGDIAERRASDESHGPQGVQTALSDLLIDDWFVLGKHAPPAGFKELRPVKPTEEFD